MKNQKINNASSCSEGRAVYFRGIPPTWTSAHLEEYVTTRWQVESVNLLPLKSGQRVRAAFINFINSKDAEDAVSACDGEYVEDDSGKSYWLGCSLKKDSKERVEVTNQIYSIPSEVLDSFLFLGNRECAGNTEYLKANGIDHVLSVFDDEQMPSIPSYIHWLHLRAKDAEEEDISRLFGPACEFIEGARAIGSKILVHCVAGRSRSVALVLAYLMRHRGMKLDDAFALIKEKRPFAWPNDEFWKQLQSEEATLCGRPVDAATYSMQHSVQTPHTRKMYHAQLIKGSLSHASQRLIEDLQRDLRQFSNVHQVTAHLGIREDRVDLQFQDTNDYAKSACVSELQKIFDFYCFQDVR